MDIGQKIYNLRKEQGLTLEELGNRVGVGKSTVRKWENGIIANMKRDKIEKLAHALSTTPAYLMGWDDAPTAAADLIARYPNLTGIRMRSFPILGSVSCGVPKYADEEFQGYFSTDLDVDADMVLVARGDSMVNAGIKDGYYVFVKQTQALRNGDLAVVGIGDEALLKRFYYYPEKDFMLLRPENPDYEDLVLEGVQLQDVRIIGKAVMFQGEVK